MASKKRKNSTLKTEQHSHQQIKIESLINKNNSYVCFTDGSTKCNPGPSGAAALLITGINPNVGKNEKEQVEQLDKQYVFPNDVTNNIAELKGIDLALDLLSEQTKVEEKDKLLEWNIVTASLYVEGILNKNWKPTKNIEVIQTLKQRIQELEKKHSVFIRIHWIKGHDGFKWNEEVDKLAKKASAIAYMNKQNLEKKS